MGFAFRGEPLSPQSQAASSGPSRLAHLTPGQIAAADELRQNGFSIDWDNEVNSPTMIRGKGVGIKPVGGQSKAAPVFSGTTGQRAVAVLQNLGPLYGIQDASSQLRPKGSEKTDELGFRHQRLTQLYRGLRVEGAELQVHFDKDNYPYQISGRFIRNIDLDPTPIITPEQAWAAATADFAAQGFVAGASKQRPELVVYALSGSPRLAFEMVVQDTPAHAFRYWVDAKTGAILKGMNLVCSALPPTKNGKSATIKGKNLRGEGGKTISIGGWSENQGFYLYDPANFYFVFNNDGSINDPPPAVLPASLPSSSSPAYPDSGTYAFRTTSDWGSSDPHEISAASGIFATMNYYKTVHNRKSVDDQGAVVPTVAHFGIDFVNAFWSGTDPGFMAFGDGDGQVASDLAVTDVCGHEVTHGVTQYSAGLIYQDESGALNESFSDIFGATVEFFAQTDNRTAYPKKTPGTADWLLGEDCWLISTALRDMRNPANPATVGSGNEQPTRYLGKFWYTGSSDNGGVHQNSGVQNFFYYLLCEGGSGVNDGISYKVSGITINNARKVAYRALTVYCSPNTDYKAVRSAWVSASDDLNSSWTPSVKAAWDAVGVAATGITSSLALTTTVGSPVSYTITASDNPTSFGASNLPPGLSLKGAVISGTPTKKGTYASTISANTPVGTYTATLNFTIAEPPPGNNDNFVNARVLVEMPCFDKASNSSATAEPGERDHAGNLARRSLWWKWTATGSGRLKLDTMGSNFDTVLAVYTGTALSNLKEVAANDDAANLRTHSLVEFGVTRGITYYIAVDGKNGATGMATLNGALTASSAPGNDNLAAAFPLAGATVLVRGSNFNATREDGEPQHNDPLKAKGSYSGFCSVWYQWIAPSSGTFLVSTEGSSVGTFLAVYTYSGGGTPTPSLLVRESTKFTTPSGASWSSLKLVATGGTTYYIAVDGVGRLGNGISLSIRPQ